MICLFLNHAIKMQKAVYPGTFDPITNGHFELIQRSANLFKTVIVAVAKNPSKGTLFSLDERVSMILSLNLPKNVQVVGFENLLVDFLDSQKSYILIRGLRVTSDFEYELQLANMNRSLNAKVESIFLTPSEKNSFISSTMVKEVARYKGDVSKFVDPKIKAVLQKKFA